MSCSPFVAITGGGQFWPPVPAMALLVLIPTTILAGAAVWVSVGFIESYTLLR